MKNHLKRYMHIASDDIIDKPTKTTYLLSDNIIYNPTIMYR